MGNRIRTGAALALCAAVVAPAGSAAGQSVPPPVDGRCPTAVDLARFTGADALYRENAVMARYGPRPTASPAHRRWVARLERRLRSLPGVEVQSLQYEIDRQLPRGASLEAAGTPIRVSGAVPYAKATPSEGVQGELVVVPAGQPLTGRDLRGKIVVRDAATGSVPNAAFGALEWWSYDPDLVLTRAVTGSYERDYLGYEQRVADLKAAGAAGAAALVMVHGFPYEQVRGQYAPYEGLEWPVPAVYVGADEGARLKALAAAGEFARLRVKVSRKIAPTRTQVARLAGVSDEKIVIQSHTDGMNAIWDNGPVAMLAMAEHFASLPRECRPRTIEFVFTTGHLYQYLVPQEREGGAEQYAKQLDREYQQGKVAFVLALEHMGAKEYAATPRTDGGPGRVLKATGGTEPTSIFIGESPALIDLVAAEVVRHDVRETIALRGADLPGLRIPPHQNFGGEGGPYHKHLIPTVALVEGPWSLYNPAFGLDAVDRDLLHAQTVLFTDIVHKLAGLPREVLGGAYLAEREARDVLCGSALATLGIARCEATTPGSRLGSLPRRLGARR